jgi:hypothetical protein
MKPSQALTQHRDDIQRIVERHRARNVRVFGSVLSGMDRDDSDLDLLVDPLPQTTLLDLGGMQVELEYLLGVRVDVLTPADLPLRFRERVLREARPL